MDFVNETGLEAAWVVGKINPPAPSLTALIKGTFRLTPGQSARPVDDQMPLTGDQFEAEDPQKPLRYPSDFAPFKPRADIMLIGTCHAPGGMPVSAARVGFRLGPRAKALIVYGDRQWTSTGVATEPVPFTSMALTWERAYGGPGFDRNPVGRGFEPEGRGAAVEGRPLPNIEFADRPLKLASDRVEPAGLSPVPESWPQRLQKFGTFDDQYVKDRWPLPPRNLDWGFFNAAPEDQQVDGYIKGDEELYVEDLHATVPKYEARLPGVRIRCFINERTRARYELREIPMRLDTVWIDMDAETLILVWRGNVDVRNQKLIGSEHFFATSEPLGQPPLDRAACVERLEEALARRERADEELDAEMPEELGEEEEEEVEEEEEEEEEEEVPDAPQVADSAPATSADGAADAADAAVGRDADAGAEPEESRQSDAEEAPDEAPLSLERVLRLVAARVSLAGVDLSGLSLARQDLSGVDFHEAIMTGVNLAGANLANANLSGAVLTGANLRAANCAGANLSGVDLTEAWLTEADLSGADINGADLTNARLRLAKLTSVNGADAIFGGADLSDAVLHGANLIGSDFSGARIHRTDFKEADLTDAAFEDAWGRHVKAAGARLVRVRGANALLCEADFRNTLGDESVWESGYLFAAMFSGSALNGAEFSGAYLASAVFDASEMKAARLNEATLRGARLRRCNFLEASLDQADLTDADLTEANLFGASLIDTVAERTVFVRANLRRVKSKETTT